jgi:hypothetical protein
MLKLKEHISLALVTTLIIGAVWQTFTVLHFYMNQEAITETHCVNKDKPELNCNGQCHLQKLLEASTPDQEETKTTTSLKASLLVFVFAQTTEAISWDETKRIQKHDSNDLNKTHEFVAEVFNPPQFI